MRQKTDQENQKNNFFSVLTQKNKNLKKSLLKTKKKIENNSQKIEKQDEKENIHPNKENTSKKNILAKSKQQTQRFLKTDLIQKFFYDRKIPSLKLIPKNEIQESNSKKYLYFIVFVLK